MRSFPRAVLGTDNGRDSVSLEHFAALDGANEQLRLENIRILSENKDLETQLNQVRLENQDLALQLTRLRSQVDRIYATLHELGVRDL